MRNRIVIFFIFALIVVSGAELSSVILSTSPYEASSGELWLFFITTYVFVCSTLGLIWHGARQFMRHSVSKPLLSTSMRQSALLSIVIVLGLFFSSLSIFQFWDIVPLVIAAILIEFFFQAEKKPHATLKYDHE